MGISLRILLGCWVREMREVDRLNTDGALFSHVDYPTRCIPDGLPRGAWVTMGAANDAIVRH